jgi:hypothetical protein
LILFLAASLRAAGARLPGPRQFSREKVESWIVEDEADLRRFQRGARTFPFQLCLAFLFRIAAIWLTGRLAA